ncbi:MAG TPA: ATP-binding protein [Polyangiaceae bacterium]|jgi:PAS domain S-box-containing protein|nr:ATP-binding protein [Polyangiaceae bacterium]
MLLGTAFGLSIVIGLFALAVASYVSATEWVDHTVKVDESADEWLAALLEAEAEVRGYVITGTPTFLGTYESALERERERAREARTLVADSAMEVRNVEEADVAARAAVERLRETVALVRAGHRDEAVASFSLGEGNRDMVHFRKATARIVDSEAALLVARRSEARRRAWFTLMAVVTITLVSYGLLAYAWRLQATRADLLDRLAREARERLETLSNIAVALSEARSRSQVASLTVELGMRAAGADTCTLYMVNEAGTALELIGEKGVAEDLVPKIRRISADEGVPATFATFKDGATLWAENEAEYAKLIPGISTMKVKGPRAKAFWSVPLIAEGHPVGLLGMGFYEPRRFSLDERAFVTTLANQYAQALLRASRLVREDEARSWFTTTLRSIGDAVIATDFAGNVTFMNPLAERLTGYTESESVGKKLEDVFVIISEQTRVPVESPVAKVLREGTVVGLANHTLLRSKSGAEIPIDDSGAPIRNDAGRLFGVVLVFRDVTHERIDRLRREFLASAGVALVSSLDYQTVLGNVARLAVPTLADYCTVDVIEPITGTLVQVAIAHVDPAKVRFSRELAERYPRDPNGERGIPGVIRTGKPEVYETLTDELLVRGARDAEHLRLLRELRLESLIIVPLRGQKRIFGAMTFVYAGSGRKYGQDDLAFAEDFARRAAMAIENALAITEVEQARAHEQALRAEAEIASRAKDEFLAMVSHELRTPLTAILGWAVMLRERGPGADVSRGLAVIERNARAQTKLIEDVLDVSRIISGKLALTVVPTDVVTIVATAVETVTPAAQAKDVTISVEAPDETLSIVADADRLQQIVWNLLSNAVKFTAKGGKVSVRVTGVGSEIRIAVRDTGEGIRAEALRFVFEPFRQADSTTTRRHGGLGLGLAIVKQLVSAHGGTVRAESEGEGKGATFTVTLPARAAIAAIARVPRTTMASEPAPVPGSAARLDGLRVLVVDDEVDALELVAGVLREYGADVHCSNSAIEAVDAFTRVRPDVLVSDIGMPMMDGYSLIKKIRALTPEDGGRTPALALTAYARAEDAQRAFAAGYQMHVTKPVEPAQLATVVANLGGRSLEA